MEKKVCSGRSRVVVWCGIESIERLHKQLFTRRLNKRVATCLKIFRVLSVF